MNASRFRYLPTSATRRSHSRWCTGDGSTESPVERTEEDYPRIAPVVPRQQRNELKRTTLVSSQWGLRYRVGDESEIRAQTLVSETRSDAAESRRCRFPWASAVCHTCSSCIYIVSAITPRVITAR